MEKRTAPSGTESLPASFHYRRSIAPMMWVFLSLACMELVVVHFLLALWSPWIALAVSVLTLPTVFWLIWTIASFKRLPIVIEQDRLIMRTGTLKRLDVPLAQIRGLRGRWSAADLKDGGVANFALIAYPNIVLDLDRELAGRKRGIWAIAHKLDDPDAFAAALKARLADAPSRHLTQSATSAAT
jgi:hypothetical protein